MWRFLQKCKTYSDRWPKTVVIVVAVLLFRIIFLLDYLTGYEIHISFLYLIPICLLAWYAGIGWALVAGCTASVAWFEAEVLTGFHYSHTSIAVYNLLVRTAFYLVFAWLVDRLRRLMRDLDGRKKELEANNQLLEQSQTALRASEEQFRVTFENASFGMCQIDPLEGRIRQVNRRLCDISQYSPAELIRRPLADLVHSEERASYDEAFERLKRGDSPEVRMTRRLLRKDGDILWVDMGMNLIRNAQDHPAVTVVSLRDITETVRMEAALQKSRDELLDLTHHLEKRVEDRTLQLSDQAALLRQLALELTDAEQRERERLAKVLHDRLQQLLVAAEMRLTVLEPRASGLDREELRAAHSYIEKAIQQSRSLAVELRPPMLYEKGIAEGLRFLAKKVLDDHKLMVRLSLASPLQLESDFLKAILYECVQELLLNTAKHAGVSECSLSLAKSPDGILRLKLRDQGAGFDPDQIVPRDGGGFGLFSIRERLRALGGTLKMTSAPKQGSTFEITLPDKVEGATPGRRPHERRQSMREEQAPV